MLYYGSEKTKEEEEEKKNPDFRGYTKNEPKQQGLVPCVDVPVSFLNRAGTVPR